MPQFFAVAAAESSAVTHSCDCLAHQFGNAGDNGVRERRYPTEMSDAEWAVVRPLLPMPGWLRGRGRHPEAYCHRTILDAVRYLVDNGTKWRAIPADFPPWDRVYAFFAAGATMVWSRTSTTGSTTRSASRPGGSRSRARV
ncbi:hypothetical protein SFIMM107S_04257 [Streptomyces griseus]